jgi:hypothetical protein
LRLVPASLEVPVARMVKGLDKSIYSANE